MRKTTSKTAETLKKRGKQKKTFELIIPAVEQAEEILSLEKRPRCMTRLIEDLLDAEYARLFRNRKVAA